MQQVIEFLAEIELLIYFILGIAFILYVRRLLVSINEYRSAMFGLEKEAAQRKLIKTITILILVGLLILMEFIIVVFLKPEYPQQPEYATPTPEETPTETSTTPEVIPTDATQTPTPHPQAQIEGFPSNCVAGVLEFTEPVQGDTVEGVVELKGTVNTPAFGSYKYEYSPAGEINWITVAAGSELIIDDSLGYWYTTSLIPGDYVLKLVALDNQGNERTPCMINVIVKATEE